MVFVPWFTEMIVLTVNLYLVYAVAYMIALHHSGFTSSTMYMKSEERKDWFNSETKMAKFCTCVAYTYVHKVCAYAYGFHNPYLMIRSALFYSSVTYPSFTASLYHEH